jgi:hypothetical protein
VDVVEVAHQICAGTGSPNSYLVKTALRSPETGDPLPVQAATKLFKKNVSADGSGFHSVLAAEGLS